MKRSQILAATPRKTGRRVAVVMERPAIEVFHGICRFGRAAGWEALYTLPSKVAGDCDGVIAFMSPRMEWLVPRVRALGVPMVNLGTLCMEKDIPQVFSNEAKVGQLGAEHFLDRGFRHLAWYATYDYFAVQCAGFCRTVRAKGMHVHMVVDPAMADKELLKSVPYVADRLRRLPKPLAVMAGSDYWATVLVNACMRARFAIPHQVAILGIGDDSVDREMSPVPLSYVNQNDERSGYEAAALLDRTMDAARPAEMPVVIEPVGVVTRISTDVFAVGHTGIQRALAFIQKRFAETIRVKDAAKVAGMGLTQFSVQFHARLGRTVHQHLNSVRLASARELLLGTDWPVEQIAEASGFVLAENMRAAFVREFGCPPREYRQRYGTLGIARLR